MSAARALGSAPRPTEDRTTTSSRGSTPTPVADGSGTRNAMVALLVVFLVGTAAGVAWLARYTAGGPRTPAAAVDPVEPPAPTSPIAVPPEEPAAPPDPAVAATVDPPPQRRFTLFVESQPTAATLLRGGEAIGVTPTYVELDAAELERAPITFRIEQRGRVPYTWTQGPSVDDVRVRVELVPDEPERGRPRERRERTSTATVTTGSPTAPPPPPPPPSDDIRMQR